VISNINLNSNTSIRPALLIMAWLFSFGGTYLVLSFFGVAGQVFSNLIINVVFLLLSIGCMRLFGLTAEDVGLKILPQRLALHVGLSLSLFTMYWLFYLFAVRISGLRPFTSATLWGLLNYLLVAFAEEIYFRGLWYHIVEVRFSSRVAILISGLIFGLSHYQQGLGMLPRFFTGWLWGSVRYATGMITLLIPIHFTYNAVWLLFQGNWDHLPALANLFLLAELLIAILIIARVKYATDPRKLIIDLEENL
jgi:membrane protease YdiL (CAAX protease family)